MGELIKFPRRLRLSKELQQVIRDEATLNDFIMRLSFEMVIAEMRKQLKETKDA